ncbi:MAG: tRNA 2-thiouridine(34) synthase MnmA [Candidatus Paceibacterota bacterium]
MRKNILKNKKTAFGGNGRTVFIGLSGGVDSAVSAALLKQQGYEVVGVFIRTWHPDFIKCNEEEERRDAMRVATYLDIPFLTFDLSDVYKKEVALYMISEYKAGRTPNPDVMCNKEVKFGAFLKKALSMGADYVAMGHYAQIFFSPCQRGVPEGQRGLKVATKNSKNFGAFALGVISPGDPRRLKFLNFSLLKGTDPSKDQVYFLWTLRQEQLSKIIFPIGHLNKIEVRKLAKKFKLPVALKKDSQGICFLGAVDLKDFLKHYIKEKVGKVLDQDRNEIGYHNGVIFSTLGERHGFTITKKGPNDRAFYVIGKDIKKNILYVSQDAKQLLSARQDLAEQDQKNCPLLSKGDRKIINIINTNWISEIPISYKLKSKSYSCQIRYHGEFLPCKIEAIELKKNTANIILEKIVLVASGQSLVIYDGEICLGGGVIA